MTTFEKNSLFNVLSEEECATVSGGDTKTYTLSTNIGSIIVGPLALSVVANLTYDQLREYYDANPF